MNRGYVWAFSRWRQCPIADRLVRKRTLEAATHRRFLGGTDSGATVGEHGLIRKEGKGSLGRN